MKAGLNVFYAIGKYFINYFTVSLTSLLENNRDLDLNIFLIYDFTERELLDSVIDFFSLKYGINVNLIFQDISIFDKYPIGAHVSKNTYLRLLIADLIPNSINSGLFLDSDTIITGSLNELAGKNFEGCLPDEHNPGLYLYAVAEIPMMDDYNSKRLQKLGFNVKRYFNGGVMIINLKKWRQEGITRKFMDIADEYVNDLLYWDQDIMNMLFANKWEEINSEYNALHLLWKCKRTPVIIHYAGASKPWHYLDRHPYKYQYFKYLKLTPFREQKYSDFKLRNMPYKYYRDIRHFLNYFRQIALGNLHPATTPL